MLICLKFRELRGHIALLNDDADMVEDCTQGYARFVREILKYQGALETVGNYLEIPSPW
jgi:hypothetical protein